MDYAGHRQNGPFQIYNYYLLSMEKISARREEERALRRGSRHETPYSSIGSGPHGPPLARPPAARGLASPRIGWNRLRFARVACLRGAPCRKRPRRVLARPGPSQRRSDRGAEDCGPQLERPLSPLRRVGGRSEPALWRRARRVRCAALSRGA